MIKVILLTIFGSLWLLHCRSTEPSPDASAHLKGDLYQNCPPREIDSNFKAELMKHFREKEQKAWELIIEGPLSRKFLQRYMSCSGEEMELTPEEVRTMHSDFHFDDIKILERAGESVTESQCQSLRENPYAIDELVMSEAFGATLGTYFTQVRGYLTCDKSQNKLYFYGKINASDIWDFNKSNHRAPSSEMRVGFARNFMTGRPFTIWIRDLSVMYLGRDPDFDYEIVAIALKENDYKYKVWIPGYSALGIDIGETFMELFDNKDEIKQFCKERIQYREANIEYQQWIDQSFLRKINSKICDIKLRD